MKDVFRIATSRRGMTYVFAMRNRTSGFSFIPWHQRRQDVGWSPEFPNKKAMMDAIKAEVDADLGCPRMRPSS